MTNNFIKELASEQAASEVSENLGLRRDLAVIDTTVERIVSIRNSDHGTAEPSVQNEEAPNPNENWDSLNLGTVKMFQTASDELYETVAELPLDRLAATSKTILTKPTICPKCGCSCGGKNRQT